MILYIVRHGLSERNCDESMVHDCELTAIGLKQAQQTAEWLGDKRIDYLFTSPAIRTLLTSNIIGDYLDVKPIVCVNAIEQGFLDDEPGLTKTEIIGRFSNTVVDSLLDGTLGCASHVNGENDEVVWNRAQVFKEDFLEKYFDTDKRICLVTHGLFSNFFMGALLNIDMGIGKISIHHNNCGISCLKLTRSSTDLLFTNFHGHLTDIT